MDSGRNPGMQASRPRRRKSARPGELLAAARDLFVQQGIASTRAEDIATRAGVSKGTLYLYFDSKEAMLRELVAQEFLWNQTERVSAAEPCRGYWDQIRATLAAWHERLCPNGARGLVPLFLAESHQFPDLSVFWFAHVIQPIRRQLESLLDRGIASGEIRDLDAGAVATGLVTVLIASCLAQRVPAPAAFPDANTGRRSLEVALALIGAGLLAPQHQGAMSRTPLHSKLEWPTMDRRSAMTSDHIATTWEADARIAHSRLRPLDAPHPEIDPRTLSGLQVLEAISVGSLPLPTMLQTLAITPIAVEFGAVLFQGRPSTAYLDQDGKVHGGWLSALLDTVVGCAIQSHLAVGRGYTTFALKVSFAKLLDPSVGLVRAEGRALVVGQRVGTAQGRVFGPDGDVFATATTDCLIL